MNTKKQKIAGVDEVGRGAMCGPVVAAAVILPSEHHLPVKDSKKLTEKQRTSLAKMIQDIALDYAIGEASVSEIEKLNIYHASLLAMKRAIQKLTLKPDHIMVDGIACPSVDIPIQAIIRGDQKIDVISAASILAKVTRDQQCIALDQQWPQYGIAKHKGYFTQVHKQALEKYGVTPIHRSTFKPIKKLLSL